jgi:hypothetical protein
MKTIVKIILIVGFSYCFAGMAFSIQPASKSSKKMPESITAKDLEGKIDFSLTLVDVMGKYFEECKGDIVDIRICEERRNRVRREIVGKLVYFRDFPPHVVRGKCYHKGEWREVEADYPPCIAMTDYDAQKHIGTFTIYYPVVGGNQGNFSNCTDFSSYLLFLTYDPSRMFTLKDLPGHLFPDETPLPFKTFSKKFQTDEEALQWQKEVNLQVEYIIKVKKPFKLYVEEWGGYGIVQNNWEGLVGDIIAYRVSKLLSGEIVEEVLLSYPGEDWWKVIDEMKEREEMKKEQKGEGE